MHQKGKILFCKKVFSLFLNPFWCEENWCGNLEGSIFLVRSFGGALFYFLGERMANEILLFSANYFDEQQPNPTREQMEAAISESDERLGALLDACSLLDTVSLERGEITRRALLLCGRLAAQLGTSLEIFQNNEEKMLVAALSCPFFLFSGKIAGELANLAIGVSEIEVYAEGECVILRAIFSFAPCGEPIIQRFFDAMRD